MARSEIRRHFPSFERNGMLERNRDTVFGEGRTQSVVRVARSSVTPRKESAAPDSEG